MNYPTPLFRVSGFAQFAHHPRYRETPFHPFYFGFVNPDFIPTLQNAVNGIDSLFRVVSGGHVNTEKVVVADAKGVMALEFYPDITVGELCDMWKGGSKTHVINILENDHAGLTAMMIVAGTTNHGLKVTDCNEITNMLIDRRMNRVQA